jgi:hypothetical protein
LEIIAIPGLRFRVFVELVLNDGSKIPKAEELLSQAAKDLQREGAILDGQAISSSGCPKASMAFIAELKSGNATCRVSVDMTFSAIEVLRRKHADTSRSTERSIPVNELAAVQRHLDRQLSLGETSYWNPLKYGSCELDEPAMFFLCSLGLS